MPRGLSTRKVDTFCCISAHFGKANWFFTLKNQIQHGMVNGMALSGCFLAEESVSKAIFSTTLRETEPGPRPIKAVLGVQASGFSEGGGGGEGSK